MKSIAQFVLIATLIEPSIYGCGSPASTGGSNQTLNPAPAITTISPTSAAAGSAGFALQSFQRLPVFGHFFREKLERDEATESGVFGAANDTHPPALEHSEATLLRDGSADHRKLSIIIRSAPTLTLLVNRIVFRSGDTLNP